MASGSASFFIAGRLLRRHYPGLHHQLNFSPLRHLPELLHCFADPLAQCCPPSLLPGHHRPPVQPDNATRFPRCSRSCGHRAGYERPEKPSSLPRRAGLHRLEHTLHAWNLSEHSCARIRRSLYRHTRRLHNPICGISGCSWAGAQPPTALPLDSQRRIPQGIVYSRVREGQNKTRAGSWMQPQQGARSLFVHLRPWDSSFSGIAAVGPRKTQCLFRCMLPEVSSVA